MSYKLTSNSIVVRIEDNVIIPADPANRDYAEYLAWVVAGNKPLPADAPDPKITIQAQIDQLEASTLMNRGSREGWIELIREKAATLGITDDATIAAQNPFFAKLIEVDNQVTSLRKKL